MNRSALIIGLLLLTIVAAMAQYLRQNYDVTGIVQSRLIDWAHMNTSLLVAPPKKIDAQILSMRSIGAHQLEGESPARGPLSVLQSNPRYFTDGTGKAVYLTGSHTWSNFQDNGSGDPPAPFDYLQYLDFLKAHGHNFSRLWVWEGSRWSVHTRDDDYWFNPGSPFLRTGPGLALDGKPKWNLTQFNDDYFERLRQRVVQAGDRGIYVAVMLFNGWSVASSKGGLGFSNPWLGHPLNGANNINGVDGDTNNNASGEEVHELGNAAVLAIQKAYVQKVIDTVNDLDNVLYEISNESHRGSVEWQYAMVDLIKGYQAMKPKQHPVGMTVNFPSGDNGALFASNADWISPNRYKNPKPATGEKVILADTDHIWGIGGDRFWVWKAFTSGLHPVFMDGYDGAGYGAGGATFKFDEPQWVDLRRNMGYTLYFANRMNLAAMAPSPELCSTNYCLSSKDDSHFELLAYAPKGGPISIERSIIRTAFQAEWLQPTTGRMFTGSRGGKEKVGDFTPPFDGDAVLYLYYSASNN